MDDLFTVFRYLTLHHSRNDKSNPYNVTFEVLDDYVNIEGEIAYYAKRIRETGGLDWSESEKLTERLLTGFETGLNRHHGTTLSAAIAFMRKYISLDEIDLLIAACEREKTRMIREEEEESAAMEEEHKLI